MLQIRRFSASQLRFPAAPYSFLPVWLRGSLSVALTWTALLGSGWPGALAASTPEFSVSASSAGKIDFVHTSSAVSPLEIEPSVAWIAVPPGGGVDLSFRVVEERPVPWPDDPEARKELAQRIAENPTRCGSPTWIRNQFAAPVSVLPLSVAPDGGLRLHQRTELSARLDAPLEGPVARADRRDAFEPVYRGLLLNYEQGRAWRRTLEAPAAARGGDYFSSTNQPWIRILCQAEDLYELTGSDLEQVGIDLGTIDPATLRFFSSTQLPLLEAQSVDDAPGWMEEVPILVEAGDDGSFDVADRIVFLGHGPDAWFTSKRVTPPGLEAYARDPYANDNVYWLTWGGAFSAAPRRMATIDASGVEAPFVTRVRDRLHFEDNRVYDPRPRDRGTLVAAWEMYWWLDRLANEGFPDDHEIPVTLPTPFVSDPVDVLARFWGANAPPGALIDHDLEFSLNGNFIDRRQWDGYLRQDYTGSGTWLVPGDEQRFRMLLRAADDTTGNRQDRVHLAYIETTYTRELVARSGAGSARDRIEFFAGGLEGVQSFEVRDFTANDLLLVDVSDVFAPRILTPAPVSGGLLRFKADLSAAWPARFLVRPRSGLARPGIELDARPDAGYLRERTDGVQMIVIVGPGLEAEARRLANFRSTSFPGRPTASVSVVRIQDVFDEFSFGRHDPVAIRNFLQYARVRWTGGNPADAPAYALLFGDAHRDPRGIVTDDPDEFVPTYTHYWDGRYQSTIYDPRFSSDDFFGLLDGPSDTALDIYLGRLAVRTSAEARAVVDKILAYESEPVYGSWRQRGTLVADDLCQGTLTDGLRWAHTKQTEDVAETLPRSLERDKIYLVEFGGTECVFSNKPAAAAALVRSMNEGTLLVNYTGHGSESQIADERIFEVSTVGSLTNEDRLFLFLTASCSVGKFDTSGETLAEALIRHPGGGAIAVFSASSIAESSGNSAINQAFYESMFPGGSPGRALPVGTSAVLAKLATTSSINELRFALHGDPALTLGAPRDTVDFQLFDPEEGAALDDTLRRGTLVEVRGTIRTVDGTARTDFDGALSLHVNDSNIVRRVPSDDVDYELPGVPIYRGTAPVTNGEFTTRFFVPSALRIGDRGAAAIYVYASGSDGDAAGAAVDLVVPEEPPPPSNDRVGPVIELELGGDLGAIAPGAELTAALFDSSGINVTALVSSRSVILRFEEEGQVILVEDLSSHVEFGDDYRSAILSYELPAALPSGRRYDAVLAASDNRNNRTEARLSFVLSGGGAGGFAMSRVFNLPNPAEEETHFFGEMNQEAWIGVEIFSLSGRRLARLPETRRTPLAFSTEGVPWDGRDADGDRLGNGVYFYKVTARPTDGGSAATRIERLVFSR